MIRSINPTSSEAETLFVFAFFMLINPIRRTLTTSSGVASDTFGSMGICHQILVAPATSSTGYTVTLTDPGSVVVFKRTSEVGTLNDEVVLPLAGNYTIDLSSASADEDFTILISVRNK